MSEAPLGELRALLGEGRLLDDPDLLVSYATAMRGPSGRAAFVVEPGSVTEVSAVAAWAHRHRRRLVVQGANTSLVGGSTPDATGDQGVLGLQRVSRILDLSVEGKTVDVEAGMRLGALNEHLAPHGLFFPIEVGSDPTVGGMIATNAGGANTLRYGNAGDRVIGLESVVADGDGSVIGSLRRPKKDNSRLDVARMFIGSYGSLGVVVRARLSLAQVPRSRAAALLAPAGYEVVPRVRRHLVSVFGDELLAFELISGEAMRMTIASIPTVPRPFGSQEHLCYLLVEVGSSLAGVDLEEALARALGDLSAEASSSLLDAVVAPPRDLWQLRHSLTEGVRSEGTTLRFDVAMSPDDLPTFRARLEEDLTSLGDPVVSEFGHWADGGTHLQLVYPTVLSGGRQAEVRRAIYDLVVHGFSGSFSAEHGLGPFNAEFYERYVPQPERRIERELKRAFDPHDVWGVAPFVTGSPSPS